MSGSGAIPRVCVIVLNCDGLAQLDYCLPSLAKTRYAAFEVIVVDNASADGSPEWVERTHPEVALLRSHRNLGWAGGNNLGIALAHERGAEYVALLNDDVRVDPRWIGAALEAAGSDPWIGIVGFRIIEGRGGDLGPFERALAEWSGLRTRATEVVGGMAMLVRLSLFDAIGPLDEDFFAYADDNDLVRRALRAGYLAVETNVPVWHYGSASFGRIPLRAGALQIRNNLRLSLKHDSPAGILAQVLRHLAKACLPFLRVDPDDRIARRDVGSGRTCWETWTKRDSWRCGGARTSRSWPRTRGPRPSASRSRRRRPAGCRR